uniref:Uncharacterized protein n=2 Tax=Frankia TaxID=1854 RepID=Q9AEZ5_9ACTN|nr:hypothetical protein [Frankia torreyi]
MARVSSGVAPVWSTRTRTMRSNEARSLVTLIAAPDRAPGRARSSVRICAAAPATADSVRLAMGTPLRQGRDVPGAGGLPDVVAGGQDGQIRAVGAGRPAAVGLVDDLDMPAAVLGHQGDADGLGQPAGVRGGLDAGEAVGEQRAQRLGHRGDAGLGGPGSGGGGPGQPAGLQRGQGAVVDVAAGHGGELRVHVRTGQPDQGVSLGPGQTADRDVHGPHHTQHRCWAQHRCCIRVTKHRCWYGRTVDVDEVRTPATAVAVAVQTALEQVERLPPARRTAAATLLGQALLAAQAAAAAARGDGLAALVAAQGTYAAAAAALAEIGVALDDAQLAATTPEAVGQSVRRSRTGGPAGA